MDNTKNVTSHCIKLDFICSSAFLREDNKIILTLFGKTERHEKKKEVFVTVILQVFEFASSEMTWDYVCPFVP